MRIDHLVKSVELHSQEVSLPPELVRLLSFAPTPLLSLKLLLPCALASLQPFQLSYERLGFLHCSPSPHLALV